jgi:hypothetical protein
LSRSSLSSNQVLEWSLGLRDRGLHTALRASTLLKAIGASSAKLGQGCHLPRVCLIYSHLIPFPFHFRHTLGYLDEFIRVHLVHMSFHSCPWHVVPYGIIRLLYELIGAYSTIGFNLFSPIYTHISI